MGNKRKGSKGTPDGKKSEKKCRQTHIEEFQGQGAQDHAPQSSSLSSSLSSSQASQADTSEPFSPDNQTPHQSEHTDTPSPSVSVSSSLPKQSLSSPLSSTPSSLPSTEQCEGEGYLGLKEIILNLRSDLARDQASAQASLLESVTTSFAEEFKAFRSSMLGEMERQFDRMQEKLKEELDREMTKFNQRVTALEEKLQELDGGEFPVEKTVIVINMKETLGEDTNAVCEGLISGGLQLADIRPKKCVRLKSRTSNPGIIKMEMNTKKDKISILRAKQKLQANGYARVYIRADQTPEQRIARSNMQTMMQALPHGKYRMTGQGKVIHVEEDISTNQQRRDADNNRTSHQEHQREHNDAQGQQQQNSWNRVNRGGHRGHDERGRGRGGRGGLGQEQNGR